MNSTDALLETHIPGQTPHRGKVRDNYDLGDSLLIVATDRISAFDVIMANGIPDKGVVLTQLSLFWFDWLADSVKHHFISADVADFPKPFCDHPDQLNGRSMLVKKTKVLPVECVARGYLAGSGWKEYQQTRSVCGISLPPGLKNGDKLPETIYTPATKAEQGEHDENITFEQVVETIGQSAANIVRDRTLQIYDKAHDYAAQLGIILADTKFEWGYDQEELILIDEVLTPDSSRFWPVDKYQPGCEQENFDKQYVRNFLESIQFNKLPPGPTLPEDVIAETRRRYIDAYERLSKSSFEQFVPSSR